MSIRKVYKTLNVRKAESQTTIEGLHVGDVGSTQLVISLMDGTRAIDLTQYDNVTAMIHGKKPDGYEIHNECDVTTDPGKIIYTLTAQDTAVSGTVYYQLDVQIDDGSGEERCFSPCFRTQVSERVYEPVFELLTEQEPPTGWAQHYAEYYKKVNGVYVQNNDSTYAANTFYQLMDPPVQSMSQYLAFWSAYNNTLGVFSEVVEARREFGSLSERLEHTAAPTDEQVAEAVEEYLEEHPPAGNFEIVANKKESISGQSQTGDSDTNYPTVGAVRDFVNYVNSDLEDYVEDELDDMDSAKADKATTLAGYGITDGQTKIDSSHKLSSDLVDDTDQTNKFVTDTDKTNWNNKLSSANGAVKSSNIDNGAVTTEKLGSGAVTAAKLGSDVNTILDGKVIKPSTSPNGTNGQILRTKGDGTTEWVDVGLPTDAQTAAAVSDWLDDHPEATTTVEDGSVTLAKLHSGVIDNSLSTQGAAAEAKATGAEINDLKTALTDGYVVSSNLFNPNTITADKRIAADGSLYDQSGDYLSDYIPVLEGQILCFCKKWGNMMSRAAARSVCAFDSSKTVITSSAVTTSSYSYTVPSGVSFVRIGIVSGSNQSITVTPADVMVFLSDTDSPSSYTFEEWFEPGLKPKASLADNANGGVDISLFGSVKTLAKQSDMAAVETSVSAAQKVSVVRYSRGDNLYYCYETYENDGSIYIALLGSGGLQSENPFLSISFSTLKTALSSYVDTSPDGIECIRLDHRRALLYDYESKTFSIADVRGRTGGSKLIIAQCAHGMLSDGVMHNIIVKEKVDRNTKSLAYRSRSDSDVYGFAKRVQQDQTDKTLTILFMTDTHLDSSNHPFWENNVDFVEKFGSVTRHCGVGLAVHGGDILTTGYTDKTVPLETLNRFCAVMRSNTGNVPMFIIKGNHDDNSYGQKVGGVQQFNYAKTALIYPEQCGVCMFSAAHNDRSLVFDPENPNGGYCYYDDEISKIRVIMLNTNDNPSTMTGDNYNWNSTRSGFQERQLEWLSDVLKFEDRQDAAEWAVYIVSHIPIEISHNRDGDNHGTWFGMGGSLTNGNIFFDILHAYENGTSGTSSSASGTNADWSAEVSYSFSRQGNFIGFLCGHMHADNTSDEIGGAMGTEYGYRYIGITAGLTFAAVTIDRENNSVSVRKYGGYNHITEDDNYYDSIIGLTDEDVNEYGDFTVEY